jgi:hypothetical protein
MTISLLYLILAIHCISVTLIKKHTKKKEQKQKQTIHAVSVIVVCAFEDAIHFILECCLYHQTREELKLRLVFYS